MNIGNNIYLSFENDISPVFLTLIFFIYTFIVAFTAKGLKSRLEKISYRTLIVSQIITIILFLFIIKEPSIKKYENIKIEGNITTLFDTSKSALMRKDNPWSIIFKKNNIIKENAKNFKDFYYCFSERSEPISSDKISLPKLPENTDIFNSLKTAFLNASPDDENIILLFSDGRDNKLIDHLEEIRSWNVPVYTVGMGEKNNNSDYTDLSLISVKSPDIAPVNNIVKIKAYIKAHGINESSFKIILKVNGTKIDSKMIKGIKGNSDYSALLDWTPEKSGNHQINVSIEGLKEDRDKSNNMITKSVSIVDKTKKILFINGSLSFESSFLTRVLKQSGFELYTLHKAGKDKFISSSGKNLQAIPEIDSLNDYSLIIIKNISLNLLSKAEILNLEIFVKKYGGGLILIPGINSPFTLSETPEKLRTLLPVILDETRLKETLTKEDAVLNINKNTAIFHNLFAEGEKSLKLPVTSYLQVEDIKKAAKTFMNLTDSKSPLLTGINYGNGKVIFFNLLTTYNWDFSSESHYSDFYKSFWRNLISFASGIDTENDSPFKIKFSNDVFFINQPVTINTVIKKENFTKDYHSNLKIQVTTPDSRSFSITNHQWHENISTIKSSFVPDKPGKFTINVSYKLKETILKESVSISIRNDNSEFEDLTMNKPLLEKIAQITNGDFLSYQEYQKNPFIFKREKNSIRKTRIKPLWNTPFFLILTIIFFAIPWFIKRNANLE